jgi:hypothetical protein
MGRLGREADPSSPASAEVKECVELYLHSPYTPFMAWCLVKSQAQLYFLVILQTSLFQLLAILSSLIIILLWL